MNRRFFWSLGLVVLAFLGQNAVRSQSHIEPHLVPGKSVSTVRAIACNTPEQLAKVLSAYSLDYGTGRAVFEEQKQARAYDAAAERMAPVCDEVWFPAVVPVRTISAKPYKVHFANGSVHLRYIIEIKPVGSSGVPAETSYFISSRWKVLSLETAL